MTSRACDAFEMRALCLIIFPPSPYYDFIW